MKKIKKYKKNTKMFHLVENIIYITIIYSFFQNEPKK
jgi:hypothetical protein